MATGLEIALFILATAFVIISFFIVDDRSRKTSREVSASGSMDPEQFASVREGLVSDVRREADIILQESEDKLERISNDKIMAVGEYSDQVIQKAETNHQEVVFLYQMLQEKEEELKAEALRLDDLRIKCEQMLRESEPAHMTAIEALSMGARRTEPRQSVYREPAFRERQQAAESRPAYREPAVAQPAYREPAVAQPAYREPAVAQPAYREPAVAQPAYREPALSQPAYSESDVQPSVTEVPPQLQSAARQPVQDDERVTTIAPPEQPDMPVHVMRQSDKEEPAAPVHKPAAAQSTAPRRPAARRKPAAKSQPSFGARLDEDNDTSMLGRNEEIISLYKSNKSVMEISKLLGMGQGEVRLIIDLYCR